MKKCQEKTAQNVSAMSESALNKGKGKSAGKTRRAKVK